jgi:hypothetical protein
MAMNKYEVIFKTGKKTLVEAKTFVSGITGIMFMRTPVVMSR